MSLDAHTYRFARTFHRLARPLYVAYVALAVTFAASSTVAAQTPAEEGTEGEVPPAFIQDYTGDGVVNIVAFGDSLTRGVGDFTAPGDDGEELNFPEGEAGYPLRVERLIGVNVFNRGVPGERLSEGGLERFIDLVVSERPDIVVISEGANDARIPLSIGSYFRTIQLMINVARVTGTRPALMTIPPPCCGHDFIRGSVDQYNELLRALANINEIPIADVSRGYRNTCNLGSCFLLNLPEGLHPNTAGYDVIGEIVSAALLQINLFAPDGPALFAQAAGLDPSSVKTKPDPVVTP